MTALGEYIFSVVAAAMIIGIINSFQDSKSGSGVLIRMMGGLFLAFTVIAPLAEFDFSGIADFFEDFAAVGQSAAAYGQNVASEELKSIIKAEVEAYILDKANALDAVLTVEVALDEASVPAAVRLQGSVSPYGKARLQQILEDELGIAKENQVWIG